MLDGRLNGRIYVMVIDTPSIEFGREDRMKRIARRFIEDVLGPDDLMAIVHVQKPVEYAAELERASSTCSPIRARTGRPEGAPLRWMPRGET